MKWVVVLLLLASCGGARKTQLSKREIVVDSISVNNERVIKQNTSFNRIVSLKPFDASKPIRINGKDYFNASIVFDNSIIDNFEVGSKENSLSLEKSTLIKDKETKKIDYTILFLGMFLILVAGVVIWIKY